MCLTTLIRAIPGVVEITCLDILTSTGLSLNIYSDYEQLLLLFSTSFTSIEQCSQLKFYVAW